MGEWNAMSVTETELIPVLDVGRYLAGDNHAGDELARQLRLALEEIGFFFVINHGLDWRLVEETYRQAARLHALPDDVKEGLVMGPDSGGYLRLGGGTSYASAIAGAVRKPNLNAAYFVHRDVQPGRNHWPDLPEFREHVLAYFAAMERLADRLLPLYALSLDLPADWFSPYFRPASCTLRMSHYPLVPHEQDQWGLAPHTDSTFMTLLPANDVPGLEIRPEGHEWIAPPPLEQSFLVNSGDILRRWTNDLFLSTAHRVRNQSGRDRYAIPFFYGARNDALIEAVPTCVGPDNPPRYDPITNGDYQRWFRNRNYATYTGEQAGPEAP